MKRFKKNKKECIISIAISLMIILLVAIAIFRINYGKKEYKYISEKGVLDLREWDVDSGELVKLDGEWEFYSGKLIEPSEDFSKEAKEYVNVPGDWEAYLKGQGLKNESGTYRLTIKVPKDMLYGIKAKTIRTSHRIYLNGEKVAQVGNPSLDKDKFRSGSRYKLGAGSSLDGEIELIVHITSLNHKLGGILKPLKIGSFESIIKADNIDLALDALIVSICLTLAMYFFQLYWQRGKDPYLAYFSGVNLFMALYLSTTKEQILGLIYSYGPKARIAIQILAISLATTCLLRYIHSIFKEYSSKKMVNNLTIFTLFLLSIVTIVIGTSKTEIILIDGIEILIMLNLAMVYIYIFYILMKAIYKGTDSIEYVLIIATCMASYGIILNVRMFLEIDLGNTPIFLILLMMFSASSLTSHRLQLDYQEARNLSKKFERYDTLRDKFFENISLSSQEKMEKMLGLTKNLLEGKEGVLNAPQQESLFKVHQEIEGMKRTMDSLFDISSIKTGEARASSTPVNIHSIIEEMLKEIDILILYDKPVTMKNLVAEDFPLVKADSNKFRQIIYDLLDNAIKYTKKHGEITISAGLDKGQAQIKVKDTGIGIEEKDLKEIFNMFYQKDEYGSSSESLGLGLHNVKRLVEIQGGQIYAESIYGEGTTFTFTLPLYTEEDEKNNIYNLEEPLIKIENNKENQLRQEKVLIIKEKLLGEKWIDDIKRKLDYEVILVNSGKEALEIIAKEKIDLVVVDFILSDMTSNELCKQIRKEYSMGELPILILAASGRTIDLMSSFNYSVNDFQKKPVDLDELNSRIQSLLLIKASAEEGLEKEFQYFYSQISPHFLYNTLNSIIGLSYKDSEKARQALNNLSVYLRGKLDIHRKKGFVSLESELELVRSYLEIEELRYGKRLEVVYNIEEGLNAKIPQLTLQPIVENAVHHGLSTSSHGKIEVKTGKEEKGFISIVIKDNGKGMTPEEQEVLLEGNGQGIGFKNVMERIKILKGASLDLKSDLIEGTEVKIIIPEVRNDEDNFN